MSVSKCKLLIEKYLSLIFTVYRRERFNQMKGSEMFRENPFQDFSYRDLQTSEDIITLLMWFTIEGFFRAVLVPIQWKAALCHALL